MSDLGYLGTYRAGEEKRGRLLKKAALVLALLTLLGGVFGFLFRNYRETRQVEHFFALLRRGDYGSAYALWGCGKGSSCQSYTMDRFMEDWGPGSRHADLAALRIGKARGCASGVIVEARFGGGAAYLWVDRKSKDLGYAPQYVPGMMPVCNPVLRPSTTARMR